VHRTISAQTSSAAPYQIPQDIYEKLRKDIINQTWQTVQQKVATQYEQKFQQQNNRMTVLARTIAAKLNELNDNLRKSDLTYSELSQILESHRAHINEAFAGFNRPRG
jgi:Skp family chaperone for outer membrane proteins